MDAEYKYLFPFEHITKNARVIIYGAGAMGQEYLRQILITGYCQVIALADKNWESYPPSLVPVIAPSAIHKYAFDFVVIALRMAAFYQEMHRILHTQGVDDSKIICVFERNGETPNIFSDRNDDRKGFERIKGKAFAYEESEQSIAVLSTGGLGDMVIQKRFIMELIHFSPNCVIDFYNIRAITFLKDLYTDCPNVNSVIEDLGYRYLHNQKNYALGLTIEACHFIKVDRWCGNFFPSEFRRRIERLKTASEKEDAGISTPVHLTLIRRLYQGLNAYSGFNYNGAFSIRDKNVNIPLDLSWESKFEELGLRQYITVNLGNGDCDDNQFVAKTWPKENFESVVLEFKKKYPSIKVVQVGGSTSRKIKGTDKYILGENFKIVLYVLKHSILHLDIEGGLVHIATQLGTKCVVLFGPTVKKYYGYEQNINIYAGTCHNCWGLYSNVNLCARNLKKPECMDSITPVRVNAAINQYMKKI